MIESNQKKINDMISSKSVFVFDFDGVLADSVDIKAQAFAKLYQPYGNKVVDMVVDHHWRNGGMSRFDKFKYYHKNFLNTSLNNKEIRELSKNFSDLVVTSVINSPEIGGVNKFLENYCINDKLCFVNSATPTNEIIKIVSQRKMDKFFVSVYGSPKSKFNNLKSIFSEYNLTPEKTVFFGDAVSDLSAADRAGCEFIGVGNYLNSVLSRSKRKYGLLTNFQKVE
jgi:phosphoglycolate phosphatase-like HAD superfamily hydrolase